jgi:hypothetical protein
MPQSCYCAAVTIAVTHAHCKEQKRHRSGKRYRFAKAIRPAVHRSAPHPVRDFIDDPSILPDRYAMYIHGNCLEPQIPDGECVLIDKTASYKPGDLVMIYRRREAVPLGQFQGQSKRLVMAPPSWVKFPYREHPATSFAAMLFLGGAMIWLR